MLVVEVEAYSLALLLVPSSAFEATKRDDSVEISKTLSLKYKAIFTQIYLLRKAVHGTKYAVYLLEDHKLILAFLLVSD